MQAAVLALILGERARPTSLALFRGDVCVAVVLCCDMCVSHTRTLNVATDNKTRHTTHATPWCVPPKWLGPHNKGTGTRSGGKHAQSLTNYTVRSKSFWGVLAEPLYYWGLQNRVNRPRLAVKPKIKRQNTEGSLSASSARYPCGVCATSLSAVRSESGACCWWEFGDASFYMHVYIPDQGQWGNAK